MSTKIKESKVTNNSSNLQEIEVTDNTQTKGKVSGKFNLNESAKAEESLEKIDKNQLFSKELKNFFCPIKFVWEEVEELKALVPLVKAGTIALETIQPSIDKAEKEFFELNAELIESSNKLSFAEVLAKLQSDKVLYNKVLTACKIASLEESDYIKDGKVMIYRANQCTDKDGNNRYTDVTLKAEENGNEFTAKLFVEYREITTDNILLAIRYYTSKLEAQKSIINQLADYRRILVNVRMNVQKAKDNKFTKEQVLQIIDNVFA